LDQGHDYLHGHREEGRGEGLRGLARRAVRVTLASKLDARRRPQDHALRARLQTAGQIIFGLFSLLIAAISIYILIKVVSAVSLGALRQAIAATGIDQIALAAFFTILSYLALTGYDGLALRQLQLRVPYKKTALASFTSYAVSFTLGFPLITGGTVRYWIYSQAGLTASKVASLTVIAGVTLWFGMIFVIGAGLTFHAREISEINYFWPFFNVVIGIAILTAILAYLVWVAIRRRQIRFKNFYLELPGPTLTIGQIILGVIDQSAAAAALYVLLPNHAGFDYFAFAAIYVFACILGVVSNAPGGIGVFEAVMLKAVPIGSGEALLASLVLFRVIYYLIPFLFALAFLGAHEGFRHWNSLREAMRRSEEETALEDEINPLRRFYRIIRGLASRS